MSKRIAILTIFAAGVFAVAISFSQLLDVPSTSFHNNVTTVQNQPGFSFLEQSATVISSAAYSISAFSLPAVVIIQSHLPSCLLFAIFGVTDDKDICTYVEEASLYPDHFFEVTFTLIISPNAP